MIQMEHPHFQGGSPPASSPAGHLRPHQEDITMLLELTQDEAAALLELIERELSDLNPEIRHTDTSSVREELRVFQRTLDDLRTKLVAA